MFSSSSTTSLVRVSVLFVCWAVKGSFSQKAEDYECPQSNGLFADPKTCRRFINCVEKFPYLSNCPGGLFFDDISKACTFRNEATCGPISTTEAPSTTQSPDAARKCERNQCQLPNCFCSPDGTGTPDDMNPRDIPQMIIITLDGAINLNNFRTYKDLFNYHDLVNPNGCPIRGTFFITHEYSNYQQIQDLYADGHEIALHTITLRRGLETADYETWTNEMIGMREILRKFGNISLADILGMRAPYLQPGKNVQYEVLRDFKLVYDSSIGVPPLPIPIWPYTLDYQIPHECRAGTCPTNSFFGIWELPLNAHYVSDYDGGHCQYLDQCVLFHHDPEDIFNWLKEDFERYYNQNRAPYMMPFHTNWFQQKKLEDGLLLFLEWVSKKKDVWFVTATQALLWMTDPVPASQLTSYDAWDCRKIPPRSKPCNLPVKCGPLAFPGSEDLSGSRYMTTCVTCPRQYPWLGDYRGAGGDTTDIYRPEIIPAA